ncbi:unnamed protein product, partial [Iphiclides podalirius]
MAASGSDSNRNGEVEIGEIMERFGKYQIVQYLYTCISTIFVTITHINYVFVAGELNYRCRIPECDGDFAAYNQTWWPANATDRCTRPIFKEYIGQACTKQSFAGTLEECTEWIYETNDTLIAELNLACQPWKSNMVGTVHSIGMLLGTVASGWMTDRFGRKPTLIFCSVGSCLGHLKAFVSSYNVYIFIEVLEAVITGGTYTAVMVLMVEICGKEKRLLSGLLFAYAIYMGESESPRWQILNGKTEDAKKALLHIAKVNKRNIDKQKLANMTDEGLKKEFKIVNYQQKETSADAFKSKEIMKRLFIGAFCRFSASFVYYGLMVNSVFLPGNRYTNFMLASLMSYPGELLALYLMNRFGRKLPLVCGYIACGLLCVTSVCFPEDYTWLKTTFFLIGKLLVSGCFTGVVMYTMELFPTNVRGTLIGICALTSSVGNVLAPLTPILNTVSIILPSILFGCLAAISGFLLLNTPETKDMPLMDTIEQVETSVKNSPKIYNRSVNGEDNPSFDKNDVM